LAISRSPARGAMGSKIIPSLSRISKRGFVLALTDVTKIEAIGIYLFTHSQYKENETVLFLIRPIKIKLNLIYLYEKCHDRTF
jgi:hypothetical protein